MPGKLSRFLCVGIILSPGSARSDECAGPGDLRVDGYVGPEDLAYLEFCLTGPGELLLLGDCPTGMFEAADIDDDADVDLRDVALFAASFGSDYFVYAPYREDKDAENLAIAISGALRAPDELYDRIRGDLARIRAVYPETTDLHHRVGYSPTHLLVRLDPGVGLGVLEPLNRYFQASLLESYEIVPGLHLLQFCDTLNMPLLATKYAQIEGVMHAYSDYAAGDGDWIRVQFAGGIGHYILRAGSGDCLMGCLCSRVWVVDVEVTGEVRLVSYDVYGDCE